MAKNATELVDDARYFFVAVFTQAHQLVMLPRLFALFIARVVDVQGFLGGSARFASKICSLKDFQSSFLPPWVFELFEVGFRASGFHNVTDNAGQVVTECDRTGQGKVSARLIAR